MQENQQKASIKQHEAILQFPNLVLLTKFLRYLLQKFLPNLMYNKHLGKRQHPVSLFQLKPLCMSCYFILLESSTTLTRPVTGVRVALPALRDFLNSTAVVHWKNHNKAQPHLGNRVHCVLFLEVLWFCFPFRNRTQSHRLSHVLFPSFCSIFSIIYFSKYKTQFVVTPGSWLSETTRLP